MHPDNRNSVWYCATGQIPQVGANTICVRVMSEVEGEEKVTAFNRSALSPNKFFFLIL